MEKEWMTTTELAAWLGIDRHTAVELLKAEGIPVLKLNRGIRVTRENAERLLALRTGTLSQDGEM